MRTAFLNHSSLYLSEAELTTSGDFGLPRELLTAGIADNDHACPAFTWILGICTLVLTLGRQALYPLSHLSRPRVERIF